MMTTPDFNTQLKTLKTRCDGLLDQHIPKHIAGTADSIFADKSILCDAMRYTALNGGKRIRPMLVYATGLAFSISLDKLDLAACAVEVLHAGSLIHDDLPAMDDDDLRRGKPTCHIAFDEATAILAGDGLQCYAYELLADQQPFLPATVIVNMVKTLAHAHGSQGITGGQSLDILSDQLTLSIDDLETVHRLKTGALISAAIKLGYLTAEQTDVNEQTALYQFADTIGLAFQIVDDILDIESSTEVLGKPNQSDIQNSKSTYPALIGLTPAKQLAKQLFETAMENLAVFGEGFDFLRFISNYIITRVA